jgi:hypothetical protein
MDKEEKQLLNEMLLQLRRISTSINYIALDLAQQREKQNKTLLKNEGNYDNKLF